MINELDKTRKLTAYKLFNTSISFEYMFGTFMVITHTTCKYFNHNLTKLQNLCKMCHFTHVHE